MWSRPLRSRIDYSSTSRKTFLVEDLPATGAPIRMPERTPEEQKEFHAKALEILKSFAGKFEHLPPSKGFSANMLIPIQPLPGGALPSYEKTEWKVTLESVPAKNVVAVVKLLRERLDMPMAQAFTLVRGLDAAHVLEDSNVVLRDGASYGDALELVRLLQSAGAEASMR